MPFPGVRPWIDPGQPPAFQAKVVWCSNSRVFTCVQDYPGDCISRVSNVTSNWLGLPYPPGRHLRCDPYRESLGSLRAYYYNPHIIIISQPYCSLCMPKARGGMLRIVSKYWNHGKDHGDEPRTYPLHNRGHVT